ncbi:type II toxin-antitoxin system HicB family antitoxin [Clavibacter lycopersici]|nr:type II toxin-antitoxin system HicB family antitoxin [Clavibacter lycopersici]
MRIVISIPDADLERSDRVAERHGLTRSEFHLVAGRSSPMVWRARAGRS